MKAFAFLIGQVTKDGIRFQQFVPEVIFKQVRCFGRKTLPRFTMQKDERCSAAETFAAPENPGQHSIPTFWMIAYTEIIQGAL